MVYPTRGWTLQELLAPASVEFFSLEGKRIDKKSLERQIHEITGISIPALQAIYLLLALLSEYHGQQNVILLAKKMRRTLY